MLVFAFVPDVNERAQKTVPFQAMAFHSPVEAIVRCTQVIPSVLVFALVPDVNERAQKTVCPAAF